MHGSSHTRRVSFYANLIGRKEFLNKSDMKLLSEIARNHDIGRINDNEDKRHGKNSVQKLLQEDKQILEGFSDEDKFIFEFVVEQHSLSKEENNKNLAKLEQDQKDRTKLSKYKKIKYPFLDEKIKSDMILELKQRYGIDDKDFGLTDENLIEKAIEEYEKLDSQISTHIDIKRCKKILEIFKDADKLDRVRLDPEGIYKKEGLDIEGLNLESSKSLEYLAYEGLDKLTQIFDIDRNILELDEYIKLLEEKNLESKISSKINDKEQELNSKINLFKNNLINFVDRKVEINGINKVKEKLKNIVPSIFKERKHEKIKDYNIKE